jgi:hypothetical protein
LRTIAWKNAQKSYDVIYIDSYDRN